MLTELLTIFAKILILLGIGYFFTKKNIITPELKKGISTLLLRVVLYFSILSSSQQELNSTYLKGFFITLAVFSIYYVLSLTILGKVSEGFALSAKGKRIFVTMSVFANVAFIGFPMAGELIGEEGVLYTVAVNVAYQLFFYSYGVYLLSQGSESPEKLDLKSILKNDILLFSVCSVILYLLPVRMPAFLQSTLSMVGNMMTPLSMFAIGAEIAGIQLKEILKDRYSYLISFLRLLFFPLLMLAVVKVLGFSENLGLTLVMLSAISPGSLNVIMAQEYGCEPEFAARSVAQAMLFMVLTLPLVVTIAKYVYAL